MENQEVISQAQENSIEENNYEENEYQADDTNDQNGENDEETQEEHEESGENEDETDEDGETVVVGDETPTTMDVVVVNRDAMNSNLNNISFNSVALLIIVFLVALRIVGGFSWDEHK